MLRLGPKPGVCPLHPRSRLPTQHLLCDPPNSCLHCWITKQHAHVVHGGILQRNFKIVHKIPTRCPGMVGAVTGAALHHLHHEINIQMDYLMLLLHGEHCLDLIDNVIVLLVHATGDNVVGIEPSDE